MLGNFGQPRAQNRLYLNGGAGTFTDASLASLPALEDGTASVGFVDTDGEPATFASSSAVLRVPDGSLRERLNETTVCFKRLCDAEIAAYLAGGEWRGKAGGYAIQGAAEGLVRWIRGSHSGVMGLPLYETRALLKAAGFAIG